MEIPQWKRAPHQQRRAWGLARMWALLALLIGLGQPAVAAPLKTYDEVVAALPHTDAAGEVVDADGKPAAGAEVFLYYEAGFAGYRDRLAGRVKADEQGQFKFDKAVVWEPPTAESQRSFNPKYDVIARHPRLGMGYAVFKKDDPSEGLEITLEQTVPFTTSVNDPEGKPIDGARLHLNNLPKPKKSLYTEADYNVVRLRLNIGLVSGQTGQDGQVTLESIPGSGFTAVKDGYTKNFSATKFTLYPALPITGRVLDPDGKPVGGIPTWLNYSGKPIGCVEYAVTDAEGRYAYPHFPVPVSAQKAGGATGKVTLTPLDNRAGAKAVTQSVTFEVQAGEKSITRDLTFKRGLRFAGQVVDAATGKPVPRMNLYRTDSNGGNSLTTMQADEQGRFEAIYPPGSQVSLYMNQSRTGDYILDQEQSGRQAYTTLLKGDTTDVALKARILPVKTLQGSVLGADGKPAANASVYVHSSVPPVKSGKDGRFTLKVAPAATDFDLLAIDANKKAGAAVHCRAGAGEATLRLQPLQDYAGKAVTPAGLPADHLKFTLYPVLNEMTISQASQETTTTAEGTFRARGLLPQGTYRATWSGDNDQNRDYDYGSATIELAGLKSGDAITFEAKQYVNALMGKVVDAQDKPLAGASVKVQSRELLTQNVEYDKRYTSDKEGNFTIERLAAGKVEIQVSHPGHKTRSLVTDSDNIECVVKMNPQTMESVARFMVLDEQDQPLSGTQVKIITRFPGKIADLSETGGMTSPTLTLKTDASGVAEYRMAPPAPASVTLLGKLFGQTQGQQGGIYCCDLPGYDLAFGRINAQEDAEILVRLARSGKGFSSQVVDEQQKPVAGVRLELVGWGAKGSRSISYFQGSENGIGIVALTDKDGRFEFPRISPVGNLSFAVSAAGFAKSNQSVYEGNENAKRFVISKPGTVEGKVLDKETGKPVGGGQIYYYSQGGGRSDQAKVAEDGTFRITGIPMGDYYLQYNPGRLGNYMTETQLTVTVAGGQSAKATLEVVAGGTIRGKLIDATTGQTPKDTYYIQISRVEGEGQSRRSSLVGCQSNGTWNYQTPAGTYQISAVLRTNTSQPQGPSKTIKVEKGKTYDNVVIEVGPRPAPAAP